MGPVAVGNVVKSFTIGNTKVKICDDYCRDRTPEEVEQILARIADIALRAFNAAATEDAYKK